MTPSETPKIAKFAPKGIKSVDVRRFAREGKTVAQIAELLNVSGATVNYHLKASKRKRAQAKADNTVTKTVLAPKAFELEIFGTTVYTDRQPNSVSFTANKLTIK